MYKSISKPEIIAMVACPSCAAYRGEPCSFAPVEDPMRRREAAGQSHLARKQLAEKRMAELEAPIKLEL